MQFAVLALIASTSAIRIQSSACKEGGVAAKDATHTVERDSCWYAKLSQTCAEGGVAAADATHTVARDGCFFTA